MLQDPNSESGEYLRLFPEILHGHKNLMAYVSDGSLKKSLLSQKLLHVTDKKILGRILHSMAKNVLKNCKKMMAIVKRKDSPYKDGRFPSGTNWEDYNLWFLIEIGKPCDRKDAARIDAGLKKAPAVQKEAANARNEGNAGNAGNVSNDVSSAAGNASNDSNATGRIDKPNNVDHGSGGEEQAGHRSLLNGNGTRDLLSAEEEQDKYPNK